MTPPQPGINWHLPGNPAADGELASPSTTLGDALGLGRGEPLADFTYAGFFFAERTRLHELTLVATESRAGADLGLGRHGELAGKPAYRSRTDEPDPSTDPARSQRK